MIWSPQQEAALKAIGAWRKAREQQVFYLGGYAGTGKTTLIKELASHGGVVVCSYTGKAVHALRRKGCRNVKTIHHLLYFPESLDESDLSAAKLTEIRALSGDDAMEIKSRFCRPLWYALDPFYPRDRGHDKIADVQLRHDKIGDLLGLESGSVRALLKDQNLDFTPKESSLEGISLIIIDECSMLHQDLFEDLLALGLPILAVGDPFKTRSFRARRVLTAGRLLHQNRLALRLHSTPTSQPLSY
jgi:hypothetical protein